MKTNLIIIGLAALFVAGCLAPASRINAVKIGMTKDEVIKVMGQPTSITTDEKGEHLNYLLSEGANYMGAAEYEVRLVGGKVVSDSRVGAPNNEKAVPIVMPAVH